MSRPLVSVVMAFAGTAAEARAAIAALLELDAGPGDELILADNSGTAIAPASGAPVRVIRAEGEHSPSRARNAGAERATREWILFLDADTRARPGLLEHYFAAPVARGVGALAGEVISAGGSGLAARYGAARGFLGQRAHFAHPYLPRAVAANLLVRRAAFAQVGGFYEGVRAAEDTDFSWRLQRAGWVLEARPQAVVEHRYRATLSGLRRQWRGYAAGRAWLGRRYPDFTPQPAVRRAGARVLRRGGAAPRSARPSPGGAGAPAPPGRLQRGGFLAVDAVLGLEELAGFALSNRPGGEPRDPARVVLVAGRFPARDDPLTDFARTLAGVRVEAQARPEAIDAAAARELGVAYREDEGAAARYGALVGLIVGHPLRCARDLARRRPGDLPLAALAPAVVRLSADPGARVHPLGGPEALVTARRLAALAGRPMLRGGA